MFHSLASPRHSLKLSGHSCSPALCAPQTKQVVGGKPPPFTGVFSGIVFTVRTTGFFSLYNGLGITLIFSVPKAGIRFGANSQCKKMLADSQGNLTMGACARSVLSELCSYTILSYLSPVSRFVL